MLFTQSVTQIHHHKLYKTEVDTLVNQHLLRFHTFLVAVVATLHQDILSLKKFHDCSQNLAKVVHKSVIELQVFEKLF